MATYKIALKLYQEAAGDENALVRISINNRAVAENVEIVPTSSETAQLVELEVDGLPEPNPDGSATVPVKVELVNDFYVDSDNDRNIAWVACGYAHRWSNGEYYSGGYPLDFKGDPEIVYVDRSENEYMTAESGVLLTWHRVKLLENNQFNWQLTPLPYTGDDNEPVDMGLGWHHYKIYKDYIQVNLPLKFQFVRRYQLQ